MPVPRRNFMKLLGVSLGSLLLARCQRTGTPELTEYPVTCYEPAVTLMRTETPTPKSASLREQLRLSWLQFGELAQKTRDAWNGGEDGDDGSQLSRQMNAEHRRVLDELVAAESITQPVSDLIQEAYEAAVFHVWRSNAPMTCYEAVMMDYAPASANNLVQQSQTLAEIAAGTTIAPETLDKARTALEHDLAFYALTDEEIQALYEQLLQEYQGSGEPIPSFEELELTLTADIKAAAQFLVDVLMGN